MSFYSLLILAANVGVRGATSDAVEELLRELRLIKPDRALDEINNLSEDVAGLFVDPVASQENDRFFRPDTISLKDEIQISSYKSDGWFISIHGQGYVWPWTMDDLRNKVIQTPKLLQLRASVSSSFGGEFLFSKSDEPVLRKRIVVGGDGWAWIFKDDF